MNASAVASVPVNAVQVHLQILSGSESPFYLASPLTLYRHGPRRAYDDIGALSKRLLAAGVRHFSPVLYSYPLADLYGVDVLDRDFWMDFDRPMMSVCRALLVAEMDGWQSSIGVSDEIDYFHQRGRAVYYIDPETLRVRS